MGLATTAFSIPLPAIVATFGSGDLKGFDFDVNAAATVPSAYNKMAVVDKLNQVIQIGPISQEL